MTSKDFDEDLQKEDLYDYFYNFEEELYEGLTIKNIYEESEGISIWIE